MRKTLEISKPIIQKEEIDAVVQVLKSGQLSQGPIVARFEKKFANYCQTTYAIALMNGTATLHTILYGLGIGKGDEVITTPFSFISTANAILMQGATLIFSDIEEQTFNLDPKLIESKITQKTKAIMPVDLYGHMYDVAKIKKIAEKYRLKIIEDAAQAVGAEFYGKKAGAVAHAGSFSLYATKNLTTGLGGIITTNSKSLMEKCKMFRHHGQREDQPYEFLDFGYNYRMMDVIAAIGIEQLKKIDYFTKRRRENAELLTEGLNGIEGLLLPYERKGYKHVYHQYTLRLTKKFKVSRKEFIKHLAQNGIIARIYYPKPLHFYPHIQKLGFKKGDFPVAERGSSEVVSLPVHPLITKDDIRYIIRVIRNI